MKKNKDILLNLSKQELMQAESKIGYTISSISLLITVMIFIILHFTSGGLWFLFLTTPLISLCVLTYSFFPKGNLRKQEMKREWYFSSYHIGKLKEKEYEKIISQNDFFDIEKSANQSIYIWSQLAFKKYKLLKISLFILILPISLLYIFFNFCKNKNR